MSCGIDIWIWYNTFKGGRTMAIMGKNRKGKHLRKNQRILEIKRKKRSK